MEFGVFMAPIHPPKRSIATDIELDLALVERLDQLGYDEVCFGEHHTGGWEIYSSPEAMIANAAARTSRIRLGTGVASLAYRHPLIIADTITQLDHMTRGRVFFGVGPGALPRDAKMMGIDYRENRLRMEQSMDAIMHLFSSDEPLTMDCGWFKIVDGVLNYKTYQRPHPPIAVAAVSSPGGPRIAGKYGLPLLSMTGQDDANIATLAEHWRVMETRAAEFGTAPADRSQWRLVGPMHIAETREQAEKDVEFGLEEWMAYFFRSRDYFKVYDGDGAEIHNATAVQKIRYTKFGVIGTPEDAISHIERLQEKTGGFGEFMFLQHDWANPAATTRSLELFAEYVIPHFQDQLGRREEGWAYDAANVQETKDHMRAGLDEARKRHELEYGAVAANGAVAS
jgi:limonene 1,2-monooxygenase